MRTVRERIMTILLLEKIQSDPELANSLKIEKKGELGMQRRVRSDCRVGTLEKTRGLPPGSIRNPDGRDARSDKKIGTLRKDWERKSK